MPENTDRWTLDLHPADGAEPARLVVSGEFDMAPVPAFEAVVDRLREDATAVVVDLSGLTFLDSYGMCSLVRVASSDGNVRMIAPQGSPWSVIELSALERELPWVTTG